MESLKLLVVAAVCLIGGFGLKMALEVPEDSMIDTESATVEKLLQTQKVLADELAEVKRERDALRTTTRALEMTAKTNSRSQAMPHSRPKTTSKPAMTEAASRDVAKKAGPNPERAKELLGQVKAAIDSGDEEAIQEIMADIVEHGDYLVSSLIDVLNGSDSLFAKQNIAKLLGEIGDKAALSSLQDMLKNEEDDGVRTAAVKALGQIADPSSVGLLAAEFSRKSGSPMPASLAATSLGAIATPEAVTSLKAQLETGTNPMVKSFALTALSKLEDPKLSSFFFEQASRTDASPRFRISAIKAIGKTGNKDAVWRLEKIAFARNVSQAEQEAAKQAINKLSGRKVY